MPGIANRRAAREGPGMVGDHATVLLDDDTIGIGLDLDGPADGAGVDRVPVVVEANQTGLRDRRR